MYRLQHSLNVQITIEATLGLLTSTPTGLQGGVLYTTDLFIQMTPSSVWNTTFRFLWPLSFLETPLVHVGPLLKMAVITDSFSSSFNFSFRLNKAWGKPQGPVTNKIQGEQSPFLYPVRKILILSPRSGTYPPISAGDPCRQNVTTQIRTLVSASLFIYSFAELPVSWFVLQAVYVLVRWCAKMS